MRPPVLVIDDERDLRVTYERLLQRHGYRVLHADSRYGGIAVVEAEPLSLVVVDLQLHDGSGLDVVRAARSAPVPVPALVLASVPSRDNRDLAARAGATGFLAKPCSASDFLSGVRDVLGSSEGPPVVSPR
ncbi:MAG TPA: response regulator [Candidatus Limnocylindrales bacterium]|nr:response regulator [Candidatus Limnocylindrales bacterium]